MIWSADVLFSVALIHVFDGCKTSTGVINEREMECSGTWGRSGASNSLESHKGMADAIPTSPFSHSTRVLCIRSSHDWEVSFHRAFLWKEARSCSSCPRELFQLLSAAWVHSSRCCLMENPVEEISCSWMEAELESELQAGSNFCLSDRDGAVSELQALLPVCGAEEGRCVIIIS